MSKEGTTLDPFEEHPEHPELNKAKAKDKDSFTREEVTRVISKLVKQVKKQPTPTWGFKKRDLISNLELVLSKLEKVKNEREDTNDQSHQYGEFEINQ